MSAEPDQTLSHYRLIEKIGEGGMGEVWAAEDTRLDRKVAVKVLFEEMAADRESLARFEREARAVAAINHPNIVTIHSVDADQGLHFIIMEFVEGDTLDERIPDGGFPIDLLLDLAVPIVNALTAAHEAGITHRDLKPANIMVSAAGRIKILDFGLAKPTGCNDDTGTEVLATKTLTEVDRLVGTVPYMSPEQVKGESVDPRSDIFSMGIILYEMATGRRPFEGETPAELLSSILRDKPKSVTDLRVGLPRHLSRIIRHCLEKESTRRFQFARDLLNDLENLRRDVDSGAALTTQTSIAVLPFTDMSAAKDQQYFCDGMAEELINALTGIEGLRVVSRSSAFSFRDGNVDIREIGDTLNVATVLEGSVRKSGRQLRITAQLINVEDGYHLWSEKYDRELTDVFAVQDEIAQEITEKLKIRLIGQPAAVRRHTPDVEAYNSYLMGRFHWNRRTEDGFEKGIQHFKQAVRKDPEYARAFAGLADCYTQLGDYGHLPPAEARSEAKTAVLRALEIDDGDAEAHASLAYLTMLYDWNWAAAEREFQRALELNPGYAPAYQLYAEYLTAMGRMEEAIDRVLQAQALDPLSLIVNTIVGWVYYRARRYDPAIEQCRRALELDPRFAVARHLLGWIYDQEGRYEEAIAEAQRSVDLSGRSSLTVASLGYAYAMSRQRERAEELLFELKRRSRDQYVPPYDIALVHAGLGRKDQVMAWLEMAYEERYGWLVYLRADPIWDGIRQEAGFVSLVERIGLPEPKREES